LKSYESGYDVRKKNRTLETNDGASLLLWTGLLHKKMGDYVKAKAMFDEAKNIRSKKGLWESPYGANLRLEIALMYAKDGNRADARKQMLRSEEWRCKNAVLYNHHHGADLFCYKGTMLRQLGALDESLDALEESRKIREALHMMSSDEGVLLMTELGRTLEGLDRCEEALACYQQADAYVKSAGIPKSNEAANNYFRWGHILQRQNDAAGARACYQKAHDCVSDLQYSATPDCEDLRAKVDEIMKTLPVATAPPQPKALPQRKPLPQIDLRSNGVAPAAGPSGQTYHPPAVQPKPNTPVQVPVEPVRMLMYSGGGNGYFPNTPPQQNSIPVRGEPQPAGTPPPPQQSSPATCSRGHELKPFTTGSYGFTCNTCKYGVAPGVMLYGCWQCNFNTCARCQMCRTGSKSQTLATGWWY